jgi:hypothetical protein
MRHDSEDYSLQRVKLRAIDEASAHVQPTESASAVVILAQTRLNSDLQPHSWG